MEGASVISGVYSSPLSGEPRVAVARPIKRGETTYVLALTAPAATIRDALLRVTPPGWLIGVGDGTGRYVTRSARHEEVSGRLTDPQYLAKVTGASGSFLSPNLDGVLSLAGYVRSPVSNWVYAANVPYAVVTAPIRQSIGVLVGLGILTLAASLAIALLLSRRFASATARLTSQATALGMGRAVEPISTGLTEFKLVSDALRRAGAAIEERTHDRERAREREALLGNVLDAADLHVGVVQLREGTARLVVASREASEFFARFEESFDGNLLLIPSLSEWSALLMRAVDASQPVAGEYTIRTGRGVRRFMGTFVRLSEAGANVRVAFTASDITARYAAEEMARSRTHELETVLATVPAAVWFTYDVDARKTIRNRFATNLMRGAKVEVYSDEQTTPSPGSVHFYSGDAKPVSDLEMPLRKAMRGHGVDEQEYQFHFWDGDVRAVLMSATALRNDSEQVIGAVAVALDITERKRADDQRRLLVNELNHRVKNTLASVQSLVSHSLRGASSPSQAATAVTERLVALAKAHDLLTRESWEGANLREVVQAAIAAYSDASRFDVNGPGLWLKPSVSLGFAMALHELTTNAIKYGALSAAEGRVVIRWSLKNAGRQLSFEWREIDGPAVSPPSRRGFGTRMIERTFSSEDNGRANLKFERGGIVCEIEVPVAPQAPHDSSVDAKTV